MAGTEAITVLTAATLHPANSPEEEDDAHLAMSDSRRRRASTKDRQELRSKLVPLVGSRNDRAPSTQ